jgi:hypothetical protein
MASLVRSSVSLAKRFIHKMKLVKLYLCSGMPQKLFTLSVVSEVSMALD